MIPTFILWITICSCIETMKAQEDVEDSEFWQGLMFRANLEREAVPASVNLAVKSESLIHIFSEQTCYFFLAGYLRRKVPRS